MQCKCLNKHTMPLQSNCIQTHTRTHHVGNAPKLWMLWCCLACQFWAGLHLLVWMHVLRLLRHRAFGRALPQLWWAIALAPQPRPAFVGRFSCLYRACVQARLWASLIWILECLQAAYAACRCWAETAKHSESMFVSAMFELRDGCIGYSEWVC